MGSSWFKLVLVPTQLPIWFTAMAPMKAMKAMKGAAKGMTASAAYSAVAETTGLKAKDVKGIMEGIVAVAADQLKKSGSFKIAGALNLKLKKKASDASQEGCEPIHKRTMRFQSQASFEDRQGIAYEEAEGDDQLEAVRVYEDEHQHVFEDLESLNVGRGGRTHPVCSEGIVLQRRPT